MKTIAMPAIGRKEQSAVTDSILACPEHSSWPLLITLDTHRIGCRKNTHRACERAVDAGADWIFYLEDDVVVSRDALTLCDQFIGTYLPGILCLRRWHRDQDLTVPDLVSAANHGLLGNGFLFHRSNWPFLSSWWFREDAGPMWDWSVSYGLETNNIPQYRPLVNRSQNIGVNGTHTVNGTDPNHFGPCYAGQPVTAFKFT